jgi:hypothetical protein
MWNLCGCQGSHGLILKPEAIVANANEQVKFATRKRVSYSMPITRSATKQSHVKDFAEKASRNTAGTSAKRKLPPEETKEPISSKKARRSGTSANKSHKDERGEENSNNPECIFINRAPVLQLWGSAVAHFLYPDLSWATCLSIGNTISSLCAVAKGRSIGLIKPADNTKKEDSGARKRQEKADGAKVVKVMGFSLTIKGEAVIVGGKPKPLDEEKMKRKFADEKQYEAVRSAFQDSLQTWTRHEDELNSKAFHMYERFRPAVASGEKGWGQKGKFSIASTIRVIRR